MNLKNVPIEKLEMLPSRMSRWQYFIHSHGTFWNFYNRANKYRVYRIVSRFLERCIGQRVDDIYSKLIKKFPHCMREELDNCLYWYYEKKS
jgi:hypothetical protein